MLSIVIPAFNEENILQNSIDEIINWSKNNSIKLEVIVVNNNSTDSTEIICKDNLSKYEKSHGPIKETDQISSIPLNFGGPATQA